MSKVRLGIVSISDKDGIVDEYIIYLIKSLSRVAEKILVVANGKLSVEGRRKLSQCTERVVTRNGADDWGAWQYGLGTIIGWEQLSDYDEIVLCNDNFFGPFVPFEMIFGKMEEREADLWSLSCHYEKKGGQWGINSEYIPVALDCDFLVIGRCLHESREFREYMEKKFFSTEQEPLKQAREFTEYFRDRGFSWDVYVDMKEEQRGHRDLDYDICLYEPYYLLNKKHFPMLKKDCFATPLSKNLRYNQGGELRKALLYIKDLGYDLGMIWKHVLRCCHLSDIFEAVGLEYIVRDNDENLSLSSELKEKVIVILHLYYMDQLDYVEHYIKQIPKGIKILITVGDEEKKEILQQRFACYNQIKFLKVENRGRDMSALLVGARDILSKYKYICFCHDKKSGHHPFPTGREFQELLWGNLLCSPSYISGVLKLFEGEKHLGLLVPPSPMHGDYTNCLGNRWTENWGSAQLFAKEWGLKVPLAKDKNPLSIGGTFWCRREALDKIFSVDWQYSDFPEEPMAYDGQISHILERIFPFVAQEAGFYTGWIMNQEQVRLEARNFRYMIETLTHKMRFDRKNFPGLYIRNLQVSLQNEKTVDFRDENFYDHYFPFHLLEQGTKVVLYGAGNIGKQFYKQAIHDGYVKVTGLVDKNAKALRTRDLPVQEVSALQKMDYDYILITMNNPRIASTVRNDLLKMGVEEQKIKWDGPSYYRDHFYKNYYWKLLKKLAPKGITHTDLLEKLEQ